MCFYFLRTDVKNITPIIRFDKNALQNKRTLFEFVMRKIGTSVARFLTTLEIYFRNVSDSFTKY